MVVEITNPRELPERLPAGTSGQLPSSALPRRFWSEPVAAFCTVQPTFKTGVLELSGVLNTGVVFTIAVVSLID